MRTATLSSINFRLVAGAFAVACLTTLGRADVTVNDYDDAEHFDYHVNYMPDLDQKRSGLPGNGSMFCVPTSMMNIFAYAAEWGFDSLDPGPGVWQGDVGYGTLTSFLDDLGDVMNSADGTSVSEWLAGMEYWLADHALVSNAYYKSDDYCPTLATAADRASIGSLVAICYGRYEFNPAVQPIVATDPESGHCVTMMHAHADGEDDMALWVRDPGDDGNLFSQSPWAYTIYDTVETVTVLQDWDEDSDYLPMDVTALNFDQDDDLMRFIHKVYAITPAFGVDFDTVQVSIHPLAGDITWGPAPTHGEFSPPASMTFGDVQIHPDLASLIVLVRGQTGSAALMLADRRTGALTPLATVPGATDFVVGRHRELFVLAGNLVHRIDLEKPGVIEATAQLPVPAQAIAFRDGADEVIVASTSHRKLWIFPESLGTELEPVLEFPLPTIIPASGNPSIAVRESDGAVAIVVPESPTTVWGVRAIGYTGLEWLPHAWSGAPPMSVEFDGRERLLIGTADGAVAELKRAAGTWWSWATVPAAESRYGDLEIAGSFRVLQSRTNYDDRYNRNDDIDTPAELLPEIGRIVYDCPGDFDNDGMVGFADLLSVLAKWGPCAGCPEDLDFDGQVGFGDLLILLSSWGACQIE
jgi:hypothetical protein